MLAFFCQQQTNHIMAFFAVFFAFLKLGFTAFGGPVAHLAFFREEFVQKRQWIDDARYAELVALCQFLPGPASSQVGMALGLKRAGYAGAFAAWLGFAIPSAALMMALAMGFQMTEAAWRGGLIEGLKVVAVAVVLHALWGMYQQHCKDLPRKGFMIVTAATVLILPFTWVPVLMILLSALVGTRCFRAEAIRLLRTVGDGAGENVEPTRARNAWPWLFLWAIGLIFLPLLASGTHGATPVTVFDAFYRAGSLVFGGGHVVLPLLQAEVVPNGWVDFESFLAGYGLVQAMPGPIFTFAGYLGAALSDISSPLAFGLIALVAIFLPSFLLVAGCLPLWEGLRLRPAIRAGLMAVNAAVVGLLLAVLIHPIWSSSLDALWHYALLIIAWFSLKAGRTPVWLIVIAGGITGLLIG